MAKVKGLKMRWNTWHAEKRIPKDVKHHFDKARFAKSLKTDSLHDAIKLSEPLLKHWTHLIEMARHKNEGHVVDLDKTAEAYAKQFSELGQTQLAAATIAESVDPIAMPAGSKSKEERLVVVGRALGKLTPFTKYLDQFLEEYGYSQSVGYEAKRFIEIRFAKKFKYFETVSSDDLTGYIKERMSGSDGDQAWSVRSVEKNLGFIKVYWNWCLDNDLITTSNAVDLPRQMQRKNNTKSQRRKTKKSANLPYTVEQAWLLHLSAKEENERLADLILLGMYTGCRIGEVAGMLLEDVHSDRFNVVDSKTESGIRSIPIHTDIMQDVERMAQTSTDGYLISGLSAKNVTNDRSKGIGKRFGRLKNSLGFEDNVHTYHSFRSTLASRFQSAGVEELFAARIIGHKAGGMTYGLYAGDLDWDKAVEAMAKVDYKRAA